MTKHSIIFGSFSVILTLIFFLVTPVGFIEKEITLGNFVYHFFHANIFHLLGNLFALHLIMKRRCISWVELLLISYIIATICSFFCGLSIPTIGLSGMVYAVYGMHLYLYRDKLKIFALMVVPILVMAILSKAFGFNINNGLHFFAYLLGSIYSFSKYKLLKF